MSAHGRESGHPAGIGMWWSYTGLRIEFMITMGLGELRSPWLVAGELRSPWLVAGG